MPLEQVLTINPSSRVVRWQPGTRMSYSNPGYAIAGYLIEKVTGEKYEDRIAEKIFKPAGMPTSSFVLTKEDEAILAKGYRDRTGTARAIHADLPAPCRESPYVGARARPMGAPAAELGRDGKRSRDRSRISQQHGAPAHHRRVVCGTAQRLRQRHRQHARWKAFRCSATAAASKDSRRSMAIRPRATPATSSCLNSTHSPEAMRRIAKLAVRYLKADVEPPPKPKATVAEATLRKYEGYYHDANPRNQAFAFIEWLMSGRSVTRQRRSPRGQRRRSDEPVTLIPVADALFREDDRSRRRPCSRRTTPA